MKLVEISEKEYNNFIKDFDNKLFFQSVEWGKFKSKTEWDMNIVGLVNNATVKAAAILLSRKIPMLNKKMYYSPRGFILDYSNFELIKEFSLELKNYIKKNNGIFLKINPYVSYVKRDKDGNVIDKPNDELVNLLKKLGYKHYGLYINQKDKLDLEPRWLSVLNLDKSLEDLIKEMRQSTRWRINKSRRNYITIKTASYEDIVEFKKIMNHTADRREFEDRALSYYQLMYDELYKSDMIKIFLAEINLDSLSDDIKENIEILNKKIESIKKDNQLIEFKKQLEALKTKFNEINKLKKEYGRNPIISAGLYLYYGNQVVYLFGGSYKDFMSYGSQYLMQVKVMEDAIEKGFNKLNFYGIDGNFDSNSNNYGLFDFKRGFNSDVVELIGEFDLVANKFYYILYNLMLKGYKYLRRIKNIIKKQ